MTIIRLCLTGLLLALLQACTETPQPPLRLGSSPWPGYEPLYLARDLEYLDSRQVKLFELPSSDITMESFRNRSVDMATLTLDETLELLNDGVKLKIVLVTDVSHGGDAVMARPGIKKLSDIRGKRIAITNIPLGLYMLNRLLEKAGVKRSEVQVFPMSESKHVSFFKQGKADLFITFDPVKSKLKELGMHVLFDSSMIPNEIVDIVVVHEDVYLKRQKSVCHMIEQWYRTLAYMKSDRRDAVQRITRRLNVKPSDYDGMMSGIKIGSKRLNRLLLGGNKPYLIEVSANVSRIMVKERQLSGPTDIRAGLDKSILGCH